MKTYHNKDILSMNKEGITFKDGFVLNFKECVEEWAKTNKIHVRETTCIAERYSSKKELYFI